MPFIDGTQQQAVEEALIKMGAHCGMDADNSNWKGLLRTFERVVIAINDPVYFDRDIRDLMFDLQTQVRPVSLSDLNMISFEGLSNNSAAHRTTQATLKEFLESRKRVIPQVQKIRAECFDNPGTHRDTSVILGRFNTQLDKLNQILNVIINKMPRLPAASNELPRKNDIAQVIEIAQIIGLLRLERNTIQLLETILYGLGTLEKRFSWVQKRIVALSKSGAIRSQAAWCEWKFLELRQAQLLMAYFDVFNAAKEEYAKNCRFVYDNAGLLTALKAQVNSRGPVRAEQEQFLDILVDKKLQTPEMKLAIAVEEAQADYQVLLSGVSNDVDAHIRLSQQIKNRGSGRTVREQLLDQQVDSLFNKINKGEIYLQAQYAELTRGLNDTELLHCLKEHRRARASRQNKEQRTFNVFVDGKLRSLLAKACVRAKSGLNDAKACKHTSGSDRYRFIDQALVAMEALAVDVRALKLDNLNDINIDMERAEALRAWIQDAIRPEQTFAQRLVNLATIAAEPHAMRVGQKEIIATQEQVLREWIQDVVGSALSPAQKLVGLECIADDESAQCLATFGEISVAIAVFTQQEQERVAAEAALAIQLEQERLQCEQEALLLEQIRQEAQQEQERRQQAQARLVAEVAMAAIEEERSRQASLLLQQAHQQEQERQQRAQECVAEPEPIRFNLAIETPADVLAARAHGVPEAELRKIAFRTKRRD